MPTSDANFAMAMRLSIDNKIVIDNDDDDDHKLFDDYSR